jgi:hypothetical protein
MGCYLFKADLGEFLGKAGLVSTTDFHCRFVAVVFAAASFRHLPQVPKNRKHPALSRVMEAFS